MYYKLFKDIPVHVQYHVHLLIFNTVVETDCTNYAYFVAILLTIAAYLFYIKTT